MDWRTAPLSAALRELLTWAETLTRSPAACRQDHIAALRAAGWSDQAVHDAAQVVAYFCYINRLADGLGVDPEPDQAEWGLPRPPGRD
jgi:uncharacterized peroxidase-related enzyme